MQTKGRICKGHQIHVAMNNMPFEHIVDILSVVRHSRCRGVKGVMHCKEDQVRISGICK